MGRRNENPWDDLGPSALADQGKAIITLGLSAGPEIRFSRGHVVRLVMSVADASIVFQVGATRKWGRESSCQVVLLNLDAETGMPLLRWRSFVTHAREITKALAHAMAQEVVVLETQASNGAYGYNTYRHDATEERARILESRAGARRTRSRS